MPASNKTLLKERIRRLSRESDRYVDIAAQLRVYRRNVADTAAEPAELLPRIYGGRYDRLARKYVGPAEKVTEISCHAGQVPLLTFAEPGVARVLALGAPGGGKTFAAIRKALLCALDRANSIGGIVAPTNDRRQIVWRDFLELVEPLGWIEEVKQTAKEIVLVNRTVVQILAAKRPSVQQGNPLQGRSWDWCVVDESQNVDDDTQVEIDTRGRRAGTKYVVFETATNAQVPSFRVRLEKYKANPILHRILRYEGKDNPWTERAYWERLKGLMSEREYREKILAQDVPPELLVYPRFSFAETVRPVPAGLRDITPLITADRFQRPAKYIIAQDFGVLVNASIVLKAYAGPGGVEDRLWWAIDEITSYQTGADLHARMILQGYDPDEVLVVADPHFNSKEADKSDYQMFRNEGLTIQPAAFGQIPKKHRISMVNTLLEDAAGKRRVFVACDSNKNPACRKLVQSFMSLQYSDNGVAEADKKDLRDMTHWTCALGYGLYPWERFRGGGGTPPAPPPNAGISDKMRLRKGMF